MSETAVLQRPKLAHWLFDRGLKAPGVESQLGVTHVQIRKYLLPFGDPRRAVPGPDVLARIVALTEGEVTAADFYPPHLNGQASALGDVR